MRLNKFIAHSGYCSRRKADELIASGKVKVNDKVVVEMGIQVNPESDSVSVRGQEISQPDEFTYLILHKPTGYTTTKSDPHAEQTIYSLLPKKFHILHPVGRLDRNSEGLLLLTNDGDFTYEMTHPKHGGEKKYDIRLKYAPKPMDLDRLRKGIDIMEETADGPVAYRTHPCTIEPGKDEKHLKITLREGRKRQIRKMFKKIGCPVVYLKRLSMGPYELGNLKKGDWAQTNKKESL
jgi:23S rRNA pseudouridine2605 synthase